MTDRLLYVATASLLVTTHNRYVRLLAMDPHGGRSEEHQEAMESFVRDFNAAGLKHKIVPNGGDSLILIERGG